MKKKMFKTLFATEILPSITKAREEGQKEYAQDELNIFANFERVANTLSIKREKALMTYLLKHIDGIIAHVDGHKSQREPVYGRLTDAIVYLTLLWAMIWEDGNSSVEREQEIGDKNNESNKFTT